MEKRTEEDGMIRHRLIIMIVVISLNCLLLEDVKSQVLRPRVQQRNLLFNGQLSPVEPRREISVFQNHVEWLNKAKSAIDSEDYKSAIEIIHRRLLNTKRGKDQKSRFDTEDFFIDSNMKNNLKRSVNTLLSQLPEKGQRFYSAQYDQISRALYEKSLETHNFRELGNVVRTYFNTPSGYDACLYLANFHFDHARWVAAYLLYQELKTHRLSSDKWESMISIRLAICYWQLGIEKKLQAELTNLSEKLKKKSLVLSNQKISLVDTNLNQFQKELNLQKTEEIEIIQNWPLYLGNMSRNASVENAIPVGEPLWRVETFSDAELFPSESLADYFSEVMNNFDASQKNHQFHSSAMYPLVVDDKVIVRTFSNIRAISLKNGEMIWETSQISPPYLEAYQKKDKRKLNKKLPLNRLSQYHPHLTFLEDQSWNDNTFGRLSSDDNHVYAIEKFPDFERSMSRGRFQAVYSNSGNDANLLRAYNLSNGRLEWEVGGGKIESWFPDQPDLTFIGPPLPLNGALYCMVQTRGEIKLIVLNPKNGERIWTQQLGFSSFNQGLNGSLNPSPGISPVYGNGVLVCETNSGTVIGIDPVQRSLLWGTRYHEKRNVNSFHRFSNQRTYPNEFSVNDSEWIDSTPVICNDKVLLTPKGSNFIICLNLMDGSVCWKIIRPHGLFIASIHDQNVILVEKNHVNAFRLSDGLPAWKQPLQITSIAGRGCRMNDLYLLSLSSGEIISIDLKKGVIRARSYEKPSGFYGNLVAAKGQLVSQFLNQVSSFNSIPEIEKNIKASLIKNPEDADALAMRGEFRLYQNLIQEGLKDLKDSWKIKKDSTVRSIIVRIMLAEINEQYDSYSNSRSEWEQYLQTDGETLEFLEKLAHLSYEKDKYGNAINYWLEVVNLAMTVSDQVKEITPHYHMDRDSWLGANIKKSYLMADSKTKEKFDLQVFKLVEKYAASQKRVLYRLLNIFGYKKITEPIQNQLINMAQHELIDSQLHYYLGEIVKSSDSSISAKAACSLLYNSMENEDSIQMNRYQNLISNRWPELKITGDQTGKQIVDQFEIDRSILLQKKEAEFSDHHFQFLEHGKIGSLAQGYHVTPIGEESFAFKGWKFELTPNREKLVAYNNVGEYQWSFLLKDLEKIGKARPRPRTFGNFVMTYGNHLVFVFGAYGFVLDASERKTVPVPLWEMDLIYFTESQKGSEGILLANLNYSLNGQVYSFSYNRRRRLLKGKVIAAFGSMTDQSLTYYNNETLYCRNLQTGQIIWQHKIGYGEMTLFSKQIGKRKGIFLLQKKGRKCFLHHYQAVDGSHVKTVELEKKDLRVVRVFDNKILSINDSSSDLKMITVQLYDPVTEQILWKKDYAKELVSLGNDRLSIHPLGTDELSVIQNNGNIQVLSIRDGQIKLDVNIEQGKDPRTRYSVSRNSKQYLVLPLNIADRVRSNVAARGLISLAGTIYAFDRITKKKLWQHVVKNQYTPRYPPANFPLLLLMNKVDSHWTYKNNSRKNLNVGTVTLLDKRTGQPVYHTQFTGRFNFFYNMKKERGKNQYWVYFFDKLVELNLSDIPLDQKKPVVITALNTDDVPVGLMKKNKEEQIDPKTGGKSVNTAE